MNLSTSDAAFPGAVDTAILYNEMQKILRDEGGVIIPMFANHVWAVSEKIQHDENVAANQSLYGARCAERWWFA